MDFGSHLAILEMRPMLRTAARVNQGGINQPRVFLRPARLGRRQSCKQGGDHGFKGRRRADLVGIGQGRAASKLDAATLQSRRMSRRHRFDIPQSVGLDQLSCYQRGEMRPGIQAAVPFVHLPLGDGTVEHRPRQMLQKARKQRSLDRHGITPLRNQNLGENV
jgi:hypothetical protein